MVNEGVPGESAASATSRLQTVLAAHRPQVVLLMEGTNDLALPMATGDAALSAMGRMLSAVQAAGAAPVLATVPPIRATGSRAETAARIQPYNSRLRELAAARGVPLVDVHRALVRGACSAPPALSCIGKDDLHPTELGYEVMAEAFFDHLVRAYDVPATEGESGSRAGAGPTVGPSLAPGVPFPQR